MWRVTAILTVTAVFGCGPALGCGPLGPFPGGRLDGDAAQSPVDDWSFTDEIENIELESRPDQPYSVTVWCVAHSGGLYVGAGGGEKSRWVRNLIADGRVRLKIDGRIYERRAVRVLDTSEQDSVIAKLNAKYDVELERDEREDGALFRMDAR